MRILLGAGFSSSEVANAAQLSLCSLRATVAFSLSSHRLWCCCAAISPQSKLFLAGLELSDETWWQLRMVLSRPTCRCEWWSAMLVQHLKVLPLSEECSAGRVWWGASQKGEEEKGRGEQRKGVRGGGWPLNSAVRKLWLNLNRGSKTESKSIEIEERWKMEHARRRDDDTDCKMRPREIRLRREVKVLWCGRGQRVTGDSWVLALASWGKPDYGQLCLLFVSGLEKNSTQSDRVVSSWSYWSGHL